MGKNITCNSTEDWFKIKNKGICTKAAKLVIQRAFKDLNIKAIYGTYYIDNVRSKIVLEKLGFKYHMYFETLNYKKEKCKAQAMVLTNDNTLNI